MEYSVVIIENEMEPPTSHAPPPSSRPLTESQQRGAHPASAPASGTSRGLQSSHACHRRDQDDARLILLPQQSASLSKRSRWRPNNNHVRNNIALNILSFQSYDIMKNQTKH